MKATTLCEFDCRVLVVMLAVYGVGRALRVGVGVWDDVGAQGGAGGPPGAPTLGEHQGRAFTQAHLLAGRVFRTYRQLQQKNLGRSLKAFFFFFLLFLFLSFSFSH